MYLSESVSSVKINAIIVLPVHCIEYVEERGDRCKPCFAAALDVIFFDFHKETGDPISM